MQDVNISGLQQGTDSVTHKLTSRERKARILIRQCETSELFASGFMTSARSWTRCWRPSGHHSFKTTGPRNTCAVDSVAVLFRARDTKFACHVFQRPFHASLIKMWFAFTFSYYTTESCDFCECQIAVSKSPSISKLEITPPIPMIHLTQCLWSPELLEA
jgi:hypothetical protein